MLHRLRVTPAGKGFLFLLFVVLIATFFRFFDLERIPVGSDIDEAADGFGAKRLLAGEEYPLLIAADFGEEPMHIYLVAFSFYLLGVDLVSIRFVSAVIGVLTVPGVYWLAKELFPLDKEMPSLVAVLSAFWVATSYWHIIYSRAGITVATLPLFASAMAYFLWRGINSQRRVHFLAAGVPLGRSASMIPYRKTSVPLQR